MNINSRMVASLMKMRRCYFREDREYKIFIIISPPRYLHLYILNSSALGMRAVGVLFQVELASWSLFRWVSGQWSCPCPQRQLHFKNLSATYLVAGEIKDDLEVSNQDTGKEENAELKISAGRG